VGPSRWCATTARLSRTPPARCAAHAWAGVARGCARAHQAELSGSALPPRAGQLRSGTVQIFNSAGAPLGKFLWDRASRLVAFGWTEQEVRLPAVHAPPCCARWP
jgi:hypothetical protein